MPPELVQLWSYVKTIAHKVTELSQAQENLNLEKATAPDTESGRQAIQQAEKYLEACKKTAGDLLEEYQQRYAHTPWKTEDLDRVTVLLQNQIDAQAALRIAERELAAFDRQVRLEREMRAAQYDTALLGNGKLHHHPHPSLVHRLTHR